VSTHDRRGGLGQSVTSSVQDRGGAVREIGTGGTKSDLCFVIETKPLTHTGIEGRKVYQRTVKTYKVNKEVTSTVFDVTYSKKTLLKERGKFLHRKAYIMVFGLETS